MTTYYVRKTGNNGNAGTSAGAAWLTLSKALGASGIASGDTVYVGAGVYRETVAVAMTNPTALTRVVADCSGEFTGDPGIVRLSDYATDDKTAPSGTTALLDLAGRDYLRFEGFFFQAGAARLLVDARTTTLTKEMVFQDCTFWSTTTGSTDLVQWTGDDEVDTNIRFTRCRFFWLSSGSALNLALPAPTSSADYDYDVGIENCLFWGISGGMMGAGHAITVAGTVSYSGYKPGGIRAVNCTGHVAGSFFTLTDSNTSTAGSQACEVYNCVIMTVGTSLNASSSGQLVEGNNHLMASTTRTNVSAGTGSIASNARALLVNLGQEANQGRELRPFFTPLLDSPYLGWGSTTPTAGLSLPASDLLSRPRPSGAGPTWASAAQAIGCLERHDFATRETTTYDTSPASYKLTGPGDIEVRVPVAAVANVISVRCRWSSAYTGSLPQLILLAAGDIGVATETITASGSADTWYTLSLSSFTPSAAGWVTLRLLSRSTAGSGITYFDTLSL